MHRARFVKKVNPNSRKRSGKRLAAYRKAQARGLGVRSAARSAVRSVPFTQGERRRGASFKGVKQRARRNDSSGGMFKTQIGLGPPPSGMTKTRKASKAERKRQAAERRKAHRASVRDRKRARSSARKAKTAAARERKRARRAATAARRKAKWEAGASRRAATAARKKHKRAVRSVARKYRRVKVYDPSRGRKRKSYMYMAGKGKKRKLRKIPEWVSGGATSRKDYSSPRYDKRRASIQKRRDAAARRMRDSGGTFVPNKRKKGRKKARKSSARKASFRRLMAYNAALRGGMGKKKAAAAAVREVPFTDTEKSRGATFKGLKAGEKAVAKRRKKTKSSKRRAGRRRSKAKRRVRGRRAARRTKKKGRRRAKRNGAAVANKRKKRRKSRKKAARRASSRRKTRRVKRKSRRAGKRRARKTRKARRNGRRRASANPRRRRSRRHKMSPNRRRVRRNKRRARRNGRRSSMRRNGVFASLKGILKVGFIAIGGFVAHRVLTGMASTFLTSRLTARMPALAAWEKPITGTIVGVLGILGVSRVKRIKPETLTALGAGIMTSVLQQVMVGLLTHFNQPQLLPYISGVGATHSMAYRLQGMRGRGVRGMGAMERNARSIMPRYAPVGQYQQAAAGVGRSMGEYFASPGLQGVGSYEKAGPLAMSAVLSSVGQAPIFDGIRPDANLDNVMELAESAAGVGNFRQAQAGLGRRGMGQPAMQAVAGRRRRGVRGMGEYYSSAAGPEGYSDYSLPTQDQWIPNGPLWAGEMRAGDSVNESEIPAGILMGPGGNGVLSG